MPLSFCIGVTLMCGLGIICLTASIAVLIKAQEVYSKCVDILFCAHDWLEQNRYKYGKEDKHEEVNHD